MTGDSNGEYPQGWPGQLWLEGKTLVHLSSEQPRPTHMPRGPAKRVGPGFVNPAMAPARTRSLMLLTDALEHDWLVGKDKTIRALDALCATGIRVRRWRNEIPKELQDRLRITANDLDDFAINWLKQSHLAHPSIIPDHDFEEDRYGNESQGEMFEGLHIIRQDANVTMRTCSFQWVDLDPFGSPVKFLDSALQSLSRTAFIEVTATDTAALCGSAPSSMRRRYNAKGIVDDYKHDDAVRILLSTIAISAARYDKSITPVLAMFDGHHVRVSLIVKTSKEQASDLVDKLGWRVRCDDLPYRFVKHPSPEQMERASGPMWIAPIWDEKIAGRITEERALELCSPNDEELQSMRQQGLVWDDSDIEYSKRELRRSVRHIASAAPIMAKDHLMLNLDSMASWCGNGQSPSLDKLFATLKEKGYLASRVQDIDPVFVTDAPFDIVSASIAELVS